MAIFQCSADSPNIDSVHLAIFARAPQPGAVKTRLIPALGAAGAARLARSLTCNAVRLGVAFAPGKMTLWCAPDTQHRFFRALRARCRIKLRSQLGADLGARMANAFAAQRGPLLLIGTDSPALKIEHLFAASEALHVGHDAVFIPAHDGGYVLVGLRTAQPRLFEDIDWGSDRVMAQTRERLCETGLRWIEPLTLWDVDQAADLQRLAGLDGLFTGRKYCRQK